MRYERCKCGKATAWTTDSFQDCQGCDECGTTYAGHPDFHKPKIAHEWEPRFSSSTGEPDGRQCARCHTREKNAERHALPSQAPAALGTKES